MLAEQNLQARLNSDGEREFVSPHSGNALQITFDDMKDAIKQAQLWLHLGWVDVIWRYRRTRLGALWHTLALGSFVLVMGVIWSTILKQDIKQYFLYVSTSLVSWSLISSFITDATGVFVNGMTTALTVRYPAAAFGLAHVWRSLLLFAHHFLVVVFVFVITLHAPNLNALYIFPALVLVLMNGLWLSVFVGLVCLRRRGMIPAIGTAMQIAIFVTPVFWQRKLLGEKLDFAADLNPLYHLVQILREPMLGAPPVASDWLWSVGFLFFGCLITAWLYGSYRDRFAYWY